MSFSTFLNPLLRRFSHPRCPVLLYAATWTFLLTVTVAVAAFSPEFAFVSAVSPTSSADYCGGVAGFVRFPLDIPPESFCLRSKLSKKSKLDVIIPPIFATIIVAGSACLVRALGLWEVEDDQS
ncbi:hypothetical protein F511_11474 [Dorcoceras hygrometricum]|uniref:Uncharacterized protein n=1 Tax=Dorcoceras hygrometricum TaxID=472368 RepID=A0A2Z7D3T2_9LAMI|nr:hypothetical protein F511_11474 [Dorcoceras hygrometricum]